MEFPCYADFVLETNALEAEGLSKWAFFITETSGGQLLQLFTHLAGIAYFGKPAQNGYRITVVTTDMKTFYSQRGFLAGYAPAYDSISLMLVDTRYNMLIAEYILPKEGQGG